MADVYGKIGNENVELSNAATEATLKLLLQATLSANKQTIDQIKGMAQQSGINVDGVNAGLGAVGTETRKGAGVFKTLHVTTGLATEQLRQWGSTLTPFIGSLVNGTATASQGFDLLAGGLAKIHPALGLLASGVAAIARMQEENLATYRKISEGGVNFAGNLTQMRLTASQAGLTLGEFQNVVLKNKESFASMGGTAEQGAQQFFKLAKDLRSGEFGAQLRALGVTGEQAADGLANYMALTGPRTKQEMQNSAGITQGAKEYIEQLDRLAQITGKSREQQENELKAAQQNQSFQAMLGGMDQKSRDAANKGLAEMTAKYGAAGRDLYMAQMMGIPPQTEAAKQLAALAPEVAGVSQQMTDAAKAGASQEQMLKLSAQASAAGVEASKRYTSVAGALSFQTGATAQVMGTLQGVANQSAAQGVKTAADAEKRDAEIAENQKKRAASQASAMAETENHLKNLGTTLLSIFTPAIEAVTPIIKDLAAWIDSLVTRFGQLDKSTQATIGIIGGIVAFGGALFATAGLAKRLLGIGQRGSSANSPLYVTQSAPGAGGLAESLGKKGGQGAAKAGTQAAGKGAAEAAGKAGATAAAKGGLLKGIGKLLPGAGLAFGAYDAVERFKGGDMLGAGIAATSGLASLIPGVGTAVALALDGTNLARDLTKSTDDDKKTAETQTAVQTAQLEAQSEGVTSEEILTKEITQLNKHMEEMIRYLRETAEYTKRNNDAIKGLGGNLFPTP